MAEKAKNERVDEDLVTRFFFFFFRFDGYRDNPKEFLFDYVKIKNEECKSDNAIIAIYKTRFIETMNAVDELFEFGFRKKKTDQTTRNSRFEALSVGTYLALKEDRYLLSRKINTSWAYSGEFNNICRSDGANAKKKLIGRIEFVRKNLLTF